MSPRSNRSTTSPTSPDLAIAAIARRQHGVWSLAQAREAGFTSSMVRARRESGRWLGIDNAVYADVSSVPTWHRQVAAAVLAEPWASASHRCAAALLDADGFRRGLVEITTRPGANVRGRLALAHRGIDVQTTFVQGIRCSTPAQMFVDLAQVVDERRLRVAFDDYVTRHPDVLDKVRARYVTLAPRGGRNLRALRRVLDRYSDDPVPTSSELERVLRHVLDDPAIPTIEWEAAFPGQQAGGQRVDGLITAWKMVIEADGRAWHTRLDDFERDRRRDTEAASAGFLTMRFTWQQLTREPRWVRSRIIEAGCHRSAA
ncbi:MAG: DUF559 domain-containing protein [Acidimicrobiales bacterium]|nr:DUF559 domain-containing protein [Acidimicrobiales bacterium]